MKITPIILCGGQGSRLWPASRDNMPKHFLRLSSKFSLLQETIMRFNNDLFNKPIIISSLNTEFLLREQLREIDIHDPNLLLEPVQKSTCPAITLGVLYAKEKYENSSILVISADLKIENFENLINDLQNSENIVQKSFLIFGKKPQFASTDYGYIKKDKKIRDNFFKVESFKEKPKKDIAIKYLNEDNYLWNLGIFSFSLDSYLAAMRKYNPEILKICENSFSVDKNNIKSISKEIYSKSESISIDYALMENVTNIVVCETNIVWDDLGSWKSLANLSEASPNQYIEDSENVFVKSDNNENKKYLIKNTSNINIIDDNDLLMIFDNSIANQELKSFFKNSKSKFPNLHHFNHIDYRPWGMFKVLVDSELYKIKYIEVLPGKKLSLQKHKHRSEHWTILEGQPCVTLGSNKFDLNVNDHIFIKAGEVHRIENATESKVAFIEIQVGTYFGEDDIERLEDDYGRIEKSI